MLEDYRYFTIGDERLFACLHRTERPASRAVIVCHPLGEEKLWAHRVLVNFSRDMAAAGIAVARFDFRGEGDSDRSFDQSDFETRVQDTDEMVTAVRALSPSVSDVTLLGLRFGASVAATAAIRREDIARLILWDPVVDGAAYMQGVLRLNLMAQMALHQRVIEGREALVARLSAGQTVNIEGYELGEQLYRQVSSFRLAETLAQFAGDTLLVKIDQGESAVGTELQSIASGLCRCNVAVAREEPFWKEIKIFYQRANALTSITQQALGTSS